MYNLNTIFELVEDSDDQVIVKVNADDPLTVARFPFVNSEMAYITVTKGRDNIFTEINKDGTTWSFHFGDSVYTIVGAKTQMLKNNVLDFIEDVAGFDIRSNKYVEKKNNFIDIEVHERVGQYINVYHEDEEHGYEGCSFDVFIMLHELEEPVTPEKVDEVSKIVQEFYEEHGRINCDLRDLLDKAFPTWGVEIRW